MSILIIILSVKMFCIYKQKTLTAQKKEYKACTIIYSEAYLCFPHEVGRIIDYVSHNKAVYVTHKTYRSFYCSRRQSSGHARPRRAIPSLTLFCFLLIAIISCMKGVIYTYIYIYINHTRRRFHVMGHVCK